MCRMALIGAAADSTRLLSLLNGPNNELDALLVADGAITSAFPRADVVVSVTLGGCSCVLLEGLGHTGRKRSDAHVAGPGYAFRRGLAAAAMAFGGVRLLVASPGVCHEGSLRVANLGHFLRFGLMPDDWLIAITPES